MRYHRFFLFLPLLLIQSLFSDLPLPDFVVEIPMRDESTLKADMYLPSPDARNLPCVLIRSPAGRKQDYFYPIIQMAKLGYAVVIQETRNVGDPEGKTMPYTCDGWGTQRDGYDTVEWLAKSEWTNGKVGTVGSSAMGITQLLMAPSAPPSLKCQHVGMAPASLYHHASYGGGQFHKNVVEGWLGDHAPHPSVLDLVVTQPEYNEFWEQFDTTKVAEKIEVPGLFMAGWYDLFLQGTIDAFNSRQKEGGKGAKDGQKLVIGPWTHFWPMEQRLGDFTVPQKGNELPSAASLQAWFDHHLKDKIDAVESTAAVSYFVMGPFDGSSTAGNVWKTSDSWPVPSKPLSLFLDVESKLSNKWPRLTDSYSFQYDPKDPTPTIGGRNLFMESGPKDQRAIEERNDVLTFTTPELGEDIEVTGRIMARLYLSSDSEETDVAIRLCDVYPDGRSILVADGLSRIHNLSADPGKHGLPREVEVDLMSTSIIFAKGHKVRVSITSSNYPCFDKNMNIKRLTVNDEVGEGRMANNAIHMGKSCPSRLILPLVGQTKNPIF